MARTDFVFPYNFPQSTSSGNAGNRQIRAIGDYVAFIRQAESADTITDVGFYFDARGTNATPGTARVGIQTVTSSGAISGTWLGYTDYTANATNFPNFTAVTLSITANGTASVTRGQFYAIVVYCQSGTWDATNNLQISTINTNVGQIANTFPTMRAVVGGVQTDTNNPSTPMHWAKSSTQYYGNAFYGSGSIASFNSAATPDEIGMKFVVPSGWTTNFNVLGIQGVLGPTNSAATFNMKLYDSANNVLQTTSYNSLDIYGGNNVNSLRTVYFNTTTLSNLIPGDTYRITIEATSATLGAMSMQRITYPSAAHVAAFVGSGTYMRTERTNAGAWTDTDTQGLCWKLIISAATATGGAGGIVVHPGMSGGMRG